jgi:hypothetical protein
MYEEQHSCAAVSARSRPMCVCGSAEVGMPGCDPPWLGATTICIACGARRAVCRCASRACCLVTSVTARRRGDRVEEQARPDCRAWAAQQAATALGAVFLSIYAMAFTDALSVAGLSFIVDGQIVREILDRRRRPSSRPLMTRWSREGYAATGCDPSTPRSNERNGRDRWRLQA